MLWNSPWKLCPIRDIRSMQSITHYSLVSDFCMPLEIIITILYLLQHLMFISSCSKHIIYTSKFKVTLAMSLHARWLSFLLRVWWIWDGNVHCLQAKFIFVQLQNTQLCWQMIAWVGQLCFSPTTPLWSHHTTSSLVYPLQTCTLPAPVFYSTFFQGGYIEGTPPAENSIV